MKKITLIFFIIVVLTAVSGQKSFEAEINVFNNNTAKFNGLNIVDEQAESYQGGSGSYILEAKNSNGDVIWSQNRSINFFLFTQPPTELDNKIQSFSIPYNKNITRLELRKNGQSLISISLEDQLCEYDRKCSAYCKERGVDIDCTCGDGVCQEHENAELCSDDCSTSSVENTEPSDKEGEDGSSFQWTYILVGVLIAGLVAVIFWSDI